MGNTKFRSAAFDVTHDGNDYSAFWFGGSFAKCEVYVEVLHPVTGQTLRKEAYVDSQDWQAEPTVGNALLYVVGAVERARAKAEYQQVANRG